MAFDTFANIKTAIGNWLARSDLTSYLGDMVTLGEERLAQDVRIRANETSLSVTISSGTAALPSDFLELKHARVDGSPTYPLELKDSQWIFDKFPTRSSVSKPEFIGIDGSEFVFGPYPDSGYDIKGTYYFKPAALSDINTTNEWTANVPALLFYACLSESAPFLGHDQRVAVWESKYNQFLSGYRTTDKRKLRRGARVSTD